MATVVARTFANTAKKVLPQPDTKLERELLWMGLPRLSYQINKALFGEVNARGLRERFAKSSHKTAPPLTRFTRMVPGLLPS
jgi:hypothetical protein